jgi:hypothetical protein
MDLLLQAVSAVGVRSLMKALHLQLGTSRNMVIWEAQVKAILGSLLEVDVKSQVLAHTSRIWQRRRRNERKRLLKRSD